MEWEMSKQQMIMKFNLGLSELTPLNENIQQKTEILKHIY